MNVLEDKEILKIKKQDVLWHGVDFFNAKKIIERGFFEAHTTQRFWQDGICRKDNDPEYNNSKWMYGWSMSRDLNVSKDFGFIIFAFSKSEIKKNMKVKPYAWGFSISSGFKHKREKEEFVMSGGKINSENYYKDKLESLENEYDLLFDQMYENGKSEKEKENIKKKIENLEKEMDKNNFMEILTNPRGKRLLVSSSIGFFINKSKVDALKDNIETFKSHPLFLGFI